MSGAGKRIADVPEIVRLVLESEVSKADLLEVAWDLAGLANRAGSADDVGSTLRALVEHVNTRRASRGAAAIDLRQRWRKLGPCGSCKGSGRLVGGSFAEGLRSVTCGTCGGSGFSGRDLSALEAAMNEG